MSDNYNVPPVEFSWAAITVMTDTNADELIAAADGKRNWLSAYSIVNSSNTDTYVEFRSGSTVIWRVAAPAGSGANLALPAPIPCAPETALNVASAAGLTSIYVSAIGMVSPR